MFQFGMTDRPAIWRMPTTKQMEKLAAEASRGPEAPAEALEAPLPAEYWDSNFHGPLATAAGDAQHACACRQARHRPTHIAGEKTGG
jgi:hypothetical protein